MQFPQTTIIYGKLGSFFFLQFGFFFFFYFFRWLVRCSSAEAKRNDKRLSNRIKGYRIRSLHMKWLYALRPTWGVFPWKKRRGENEKEYNHTICMSKGDLRVPKSTKSITFRVFLSWGVFIQILHECSIRWFKFYLLWVHMGWQRGARARDRQMQRDNGIWFACVCDFNSTSLHFQLKLRQSEWFFFSISHSHSLSKWLKNGKLNLLCVNIGFRICEWTGHVVSTPLSSVKRLHFELIRTTTNAFNAQIRQCNQNELHLGRSKKKISLRFGKSQSQISFG